MQKPNPDATQVASVFKVENPEELALNLLKLFEQGGKVMAGLVERAEAKGPYSATSEMTEAANAMGEIARVWMSNPERLAEAQSDLVRGYFDLWQTTVRRSFGLTAKPVAQPEAGDNRFKDPEWSSSPYFDYWKQVYLLTAHWAETLLDKTSGIDPRTRMRAEFYLEQLLSAISPSNFPMTNPEVLRETFATNGRNLVQGLAHLAADMEKSGDLLRISQTDVEAFEVGRNLAVTPGKVVFQNELLQLIQYTPTTEKAYAVPLLMIPPWINKFYILDLTQPKSFIKYAVDQGFTVFVVSWINPDERLKDKSFEDYMIEGALAATHAVMRETGQSKINVLGYCVGGTLLAATLAYLAARGEDLYHSATFLAAQVDFSSAGDLLVFIDDTQLKSLEEMMAERGYLDGSRMATVFNMLRPKDLIWPYIVNNYLLGKKPIPFDLLYWNQDSTRMPAANHKFYLREFYHENKLAKGRMKIAGTRLDLAQVKLPIYELATREDHIAPAKSVFIGSKLFSGPVEFVLAGSGHIAGVINPPNPERVKYQHWTSSKSAESLEDWIAKAKENPGSWWPNWSKWLAKRSGQKVPAREPGAVLGTIEDAPGSYVKVKG